MCAVWGGVYMLRRSISSYVCTPGSLCSVTIGDEEGLNEAPLVLLQSPVLDTVLLSPVSAEIKTVMNIETEINDQNSRHENNSKKQRNSITCSGLLINADNYPLLTPLYFKSSFTSRIYLCVNNVVEGGDVNGKTSMLLPLSRYSDLWHLIYVCAYKHTCSFIYIHCFLYFNHFIYTLF